MYVRSVCSMGVNYSAAVSTQPIRGHSKKCINRPTFLINKLVYVLTRS